MERLVNELGVWMPTGLIIGLFAYAEGGIVQCVHRAFQNNLKYARSGWDYSNAYRVLIMVVINV